MEVAPFQGIPKEGRKRKDPKCGVITKGIYLFRPSCIFKKSYILY